MSLPAQEYPDRIGFVPEGPPPFTPYIPPGTTLRELTPVPIIVGAILGLIFGASSLYLVLKVGLTVSASIPVAVISITLFRLFAKMGARECSRLERQPSRERQRLRKRGASRKNSVAQRAQLPSSRDSGWRLRTRPSWSRSMDGRKCLRRFSARRSRMHRCLSRYRPSFSVLDTSSVRGSHPSCAPAECSRTSF